MDFDDARDLCEMAVRLGRAVPPEKWVDELVAGASLASFDVLLH